MTSFDSKKASGSLLHVQVDTRGAKGMQRLSFRRQYDCGGSKDGKEKIELSLHEICPTKITSGLPLSCLGARQGSKGSTDYQILPTPSCRGTSQARKVKQTTRYYLHPFCSDTSHGRMTKHRLQDTTYTPSDQAQAGEKG